MELYNLVAPQQPSVLAPIVIEDYEGKLEAVTNWLKDYTVFEITDEESKKLAKAKRAEVNKVLDDLKRGRIDGLKKFVGTLEDQIKSFEKLLDARQKEFGVAIKSYEDATKIAEAALSGLEGPIDVKAKEMTVTVKTYDPKVVEKIKKIALDNNCTISVK